jgi:2'-5' RNA ligase
VGELFRSFEESWSRFLARTEPLEDFLAGLPADEEAAVAVWLIPLEPALAPRVRAVQRRLGHVPWLRPLPAYFLHVTVAGLGFAEWRGRVDKVLDDGREALRGITRFRLAFPRLNCFHEAVVAEVEDVSGAMLAAAAERLGRRGEFFLPHLSLAYTTAAGPAAELRDALVPARETHLGEQDVREIQLCVVPASQRTILEPWTVAGRVALG